MRKFMEDKVCTGVQDIEMKFDSLFIDVFVDGKKLAPGQKQLLAELDGFNCEGDFVNFFFPKDEPGEFSGQIVHWTDWRY